MNKIVLLAITLTLLHPLLHAQSSKVEWIQTLESKQWESVSGLNTTATFEKADVNIELGKPLQTIDGFGACFNELGWTSLSLLTEKDRESIMKELFSPGVGANFTICRMPVGANDFSRNWYSYNEMDGDFEMKNFSIANDLETLIPFIKNAQKYNPSLKLWASPWSPPSWMKYNHHYASTSILGDNKMYSLRAGMDFRGINNGLAVDKQGKEGTNMFIQDEKYFKAYALYFSKFVDAYRQQKIKISMVMPQNEFNSAQIFPSCTWTSSGLSKFISYLGPQMEAKGVNVFFGTMERGNRALIDTVLTNPQSAKYIKGVGFQWAGKGAIPDIHKQYPNLTLYQTEQECGNAQNDWKNCIHSWDLMKHYITNGAKAYMYWNTSLKKGGISTWGWMQNSLVTVDEISKTYKYNYEYYLLKHLSHFVKPGAKLLTTTGEFNNALAFINTDKSIVVVAFNPDATDKSLRINIGDKSINPTLRANSFNTWLLKKE